MNNFVSILISLILAYYKTYMSFIIPIFDFCVFIKTLINRVIMLLAIYKIYLIYVNKNLLSFSYIIL